MARLNTRPILGGLAIGAVAAIAIVLLPSTAIESIVSRTGLADIMTAAQPPLGTKARVLIALIPFSIATAIGILLGIVWGRRARKDEFGDYGAYADYGLHDGPVGDPFADVSDLPVMAPVEQSVAPSPFDEPELLPAITETQAPEPAPPPVAAAPAPLDGATSRDLAEIADAVVRLDARLDSIEAKLGSGGAAGAADLSKRLAKIAKALDDAG